MTAGGVANMAREVVNGVANMARVAVEPGLG
jgi:hypothetical protein